MITQQTTAKHWSISSDDLHSYQQQNCLHQSLPKELGMGHSTLFQLDQDLSYIETRYSPSRDLAVLSRMECQEPRLIVTLGIQGQSRFTGNNGTELCFNEGYTTITAVHSSIGERQYEAQKPTLQLRFALSKNWLSNYFGEIKTAQLFNKNHTQLHPTSSQAICTAHQLVNCKQKTNRLFMHGQALSLLAFELSLFFVEDTRQNTEEFNQKDAASAKSARDILFNEFKNPPSVAELSKRVGINQCKLKKLFHHFFENTPYGLLLEIRMNNAYQLLEATSCQVSVAADQVGYSHASNFSTAFIKHFGISPKEVAKKR